MNEAVSEAAARLERAVGRLAEAVARPRPPAEPPAPAGIPPEQVAALAGRLDMSLAKLRGVLAELEAPEPDAGDPHTAGDLHTARNLHTEGAGVEEDGPLAAPFPPAAHPEEER
jgi:hypothetical protein